MKSFQTIVLIIFVALIAIAVIVFALFSRGGNSDAEVNLLVWGTLDGRIINDYLREEKINNDEFPDVTYVEKDSEGYVLSIIEATAKGVAPDVFIVSNENLLELKDLIFPIPFSSYSERTFKDSFIEEGELFLFGENIMAFPFIVDPMVMYWNRSIFQSYALAQPPAYWDEFFTIAPRVTEKDEALNINKSAVALGEYDNIDHAKEILSSIIFASGNPIYREVEGPVFKSALGESTNAGSPAESSLRFYTEFSNPSKTTYSWNRALGEAEEEFLAGRLAVYFGFASEIGDIRTKNPNLNFDVSRLPQIRDFDNKSVFGNIYGLAVSRNSQKLGPALRFIGTITRSQAIDQISGEFNLPPVKRDLLAVPQTDAIKEVFYQSALISEAFLEPDATEVENIFESMIEDFISGRLRASEAVNRADRELQGLFVDKQ